MVLWQSYIKEPHRCKIENTVSKAGGQFYWEKRRLAAAVNNYQHKIIESRTIQSQLSYSYLIIFGILSH